MSKKKAAKRKPARAIQNLPVEALTAEKARSIKGGLTNVAEMKHVALKAVANNLRA